MPVTVIVGCQWGDEGKGKVVDVLSAKTQVVARYQGGNNAGHTVIIGGRKYVLHTLPSGVLHPGVRNVIGNGVVMDILALCKEIDELAAGGIDVIPSLLISEQTHLILPQHAHLDRVKEKSAGGDKIGTTGRGIGLAYAEKMARKGVRACDLKSPDRFVARYREAAAACNERLTKLHGEPPMNAEEHLDALLAAAARLRPCIGDSVTFLNDALGRGELVLAEGAQGVLLDVDFGTYPYVTSSSPAPGGACTGLGISPRAITSIIGIVKAYTTRVGEGPMPTELLDATGERLRAEGGEFGATTGRPRRCGWFDAPAVRRATQISGTTELTLTKLDVLSIFDEIQIAVAYDTPEGRLDRIPFDLETLKQAKPVYESMPGWGTPIDQATRFEDLPVAARNYVASLEQIVGTPITMVGVGPDRAQTLARTP